MILLHEKKLSSLAADGSAAGDRDPVASKPLLIIAEDVEGEALWQPSLSTSCAAV